MKEDLIRRLSQISAGVDIFTQSEVAEKDLSDFPMLQTESKFLHDPVHNGDWILGYNGDKIDFILNLKPGLYIDVFEVRLGLRGNGVGRKIITILESVTKDYFKRIYLRAHDENALNFWKHLGYKEDEKEFIQFKFL